MYIQQFFVGGIAHLSYLVGGNKSCAIIDPKRDVDDYIHAARSMGLKITHIIETHLHADFISGHLDLQELTGAAIYAPKAGKCKFEHMPVSEGDSFSLEDIEFKVLDTSGHTPEHVSYVAIDRSRGSDPVAVFTGDTLFVGDVGRPDLFPGRAEELSFRLYDNLHRKILALHDFCEVYPTHGAGSLCGRAMGAKRSSTIGYERRYNHSLHHKSKEAFRDSLLSGMPEVPDHFGRCSAINAEGSPLVRTLSAVNPVPPTEFWRLINSDHHVVDVREYGAFGGAHIPHSYHIDGAGNFSTFAGWIMPPDKPLLLVGNTEEEIFRATTQLRRVGLDRIEGYLEGGIHAWATRGFPVTHLPHISVHELKEKLEKKEDLIILDVRSQREWDEFHIKGAVHIAAPDVRNRYKEVETHKPVAVICNTAHRSSMAASILKQHGFNNLTVVTGGMTAWQAAGYLPECPLCEVPHGPRLQVL
ncbi:MAG: MBL fold metallo-hydrolase [Thermodesulfobacteriota bacterium]|nr:MBL fold metallo-hydrolase [Thermodesulfobacteriota bacterium]